MAHEYIRILEPRTARRINAVLGVILASVISHSPACCTGDDVTVARYWTTAAPQAFPGHVFPGHHFSGHHFSGHHFSGLAQIADEPRRPRRETLDRLTSATGHLQGRVVDGQGRPVTNAIAVLESHRDSASGLSCVESVSTTDDNGHFQIRLSRDFLESSPQWHPLAEQIDCPLMLWAPGRSTVSMNVTLTREDDWQHDVAAISLIRGTELAVLVRDPSGNPMADAELTIAAFVSGEAHPVARTVQHHLQIRTDENGTAGFPGLLKERSVVRISCITDRYGEQTTQHAVDPSDHTPAEITLRNTGSVSGRIHCGDPACLKTLKLHVTSTLNRRLARHLGLDMTERRSSQALVQPNAEGRFHVPHLTPGLLTVSQIVDKQTTWRLKTRPIVQTIVAGESTEFVSSLVRGVRVTGYLIDQEIRAPLPEAVAQIHRLQAHHDLVRPNLGVRNLALHDLAASAEPIPRWTAAEGRFESVLLPGSYQVTVRTMLPGFSRLKIQLLEVPDSQSSLETSVFVPRTLSMQGELVDENGQPVGNAWVAAMARGRLLMLKRVSESGTFDAWLADVARADSWPVRIGKKRLQGSVLRKVPLKLQVSVDTE